VTIDQERRVESGVIGFDAQGFKHRFGPGAVFVGQVVVAALALPGTGRAIEQTVGLICDPNGLNYRDRDSLIFIFHSILHFRMWALRPGFID